MPARDSRGRPTPCSCSPRSCPSKPDQAGGEAHFELLGKEIPDSEDDDEDNEKKAVIINTPKQETINFKAP